MPLADCVAGNTTPVVSTDPNNPNNPPGTVVLTPTGPQVAVPVRGVAGASIVGYGSPYSSITLPTAPLPGSTLFALGIGHVSMPVNTADGWTEVTAGHHDTLTLDPATRVAWKHFPTGGAQVQAPFGTGSATAAIYAVWEVRGMPADPTGNIYSVAVDSPRFGGNSVSVTDSLPAAGLYLYLAGALPFSGDPGTGSHSNVDFSADGSVYATTSGPYSGVALHAGYATTPGAAVTETFTWGPPMPVASIMVGLTVADLPSGGDSTGTTGTPLSTFTTVKLNGTTVSTAAQSINVVGDVTLADDGYGNLTLTIPAGVGPHVDLTTSEALSVGDVVSVWNSSGAKARKANAADDTKQAHGFVLSAAASGATARVYLPGSVISGLSSLTIGATYFLSTAGGGITATPPSTSGQWLQELGVAVSATELAFNPKTGTLL